jgi:Icc-related predicted phosphoesterase
MVRTRIVCVSDTHSYSPTAAGFKLPQGDVLIHAGDITNRGTLAELRDTIAWIEKADFQAKIVVAGMIPQGCSNSHPEYYPLFGFNITYLQATMILRSIPNTMARTVNHYLSRLENLWRTASTP